MANGEVYSGKYVDHKGINVELDDAMSYNRTMESLRQAKINVKLLETLAKAELALIKAKEATHRMNNPL